MLETKIETRVYSDYLVSLARSLDCMEVCVRAAAWHFSYEQEDQERFHGGGGYAAWVCGNMENLAATLPGLRAAFLLGVQAENPDFHVVANALGDVDAPVQITSLFEPILDEKIHVAVEGEREEPPGSLLTLPDNILVQLAGRRIVFFDGFAHIIPEEFSDSFVEVWFRRQYGLERDGGAYLVYLTKRAYGWQAYGLER